MPELHKVYLNEEQWCKIHCSCKCPEISAEIAKQQPEMFARIEATPGPVPPENVSTESPVADKNASDAIEGMSHLRSKDKLQQIIDHAKRVTVQEAARKRLAELES
jgi:hypothetical protein